MKWEYKYYSGGGKRLMVMLDHLGQDGWELICVTKTFLGLEYEAWLKRVIK